MSEFPPKSNFITTKADSGATKHYFRSQDMACLQQIEQAHGPSVFLPNIETITSTHTGLLPYDSLTTQAKTANILPQLHSASLLSLGQLCDDNCDVHLNKYNINIFKNNKKILQGHRNFSDGLWDVPIPIPMVPKDQYISIIIPKNTTKKELVQFYHAAMFSPTKDTFIRAIRNGNFQSWPGLTTETATKFLTSTIATQFGHLKQERQNLQSTQQSNDFDAFPRSDVPNIPTNEIIATITPYRITNKAYGDMPGKFPITSSRGSQYFLVIYHYDSNAILVRTLKNRIAPEIKSAYMSIYDMLRNRGCTPSTFILDNETSKTLLNAFEKERITYQLVPPNIHRRNAAKRAIETWKDHFIAGLSSLHPEFPLMEWDRLTYQAMLTLNLLRNAPVNPKLSAWEYIFGRFNFKSTPLAPPGAKVIVHSKPSQRGSWDPHGMVGFYVGPAMNHYRCFRCYIPTTRAERISDTISFVPYHVPVMLYIEFIKDKR